MKTHDSGSQMDNFVGYVRIVVSVALSVCLAMIIAAEAGASSGAIELVSVSSGGGQANGNSETNSPAISADGRYVVFNSFADNLVDGDTNNQPDIFLRDTLTGTTTRVNTDSAGNQAAASSVYGLISATISADGRYVVFASWAGNLVPGSTAWREDVYIKNIQTGAIARVSTDSAGNQANGNSSEFGTLSISADGRYVAFDSSATNLVPGDTDESCWGANCVDVFVKDTLTGAITMASSDGAGLPANGWSHRPSLSNDGRYVAFDSNATNLAPGDAYNNCAVFRKDLTTGDVSVVADDPSGFFCSYSPSISANGNEVAFATDDYSISVKHMDSGVVTPVWSNYHVPIPCHSPSISADGRYVEFADWYGPPGDHGGYFVEKVSDTLTGTVTLITDGNGRGSDGYVSADGRYVAFTSGGNVYRAVTGMPQTAGRPSLSLSRVSVYWQSYADYSNRLLNVDYSVENTGADAGYAVQITGSSSSHDVSVVSTMPLSLGNLVPGAAHAVTIRYSIPAGVSAFRATLMARAEDGAGSSYSY